MDEAELRDDEVEVVVVDDRVDDSSVLPVVVPNHGNKYAIVRLPPFVRHLFVATIPPLFATDKRRTFQGG